MPEINKPAVPTYWIAYSDGVRHVGVTMPGQVTTTGQPNFETNENVGELLSVIDAAGLADFNPLPAVGEWIERGQVYTYEGKSLIAFQSHDRTHFDPFDTPALFGKAKVAGAPWVQPLGSEDTYSLWAVVTHNGKEWRSNVPANVWEPGATGITQWNDITIATPSVQPWVQPIGSEDSYQIGNRVTHDNLNDGGNIWIYESKINANTTQPGRDGTLDRWWEPIEIV